MSSLSLPGGRYPNRNLISYGVALDQIVNDLALITYDSAWPFNQNLRCVIVGYDPNGNKVSREVHLDHAQKKFVFMKDNTTVRAPNPYNLLVQLAFLGVVRPKAPASNWHEIYLTHDNGRSYIRGRDLRYAVAKHFGKTLNNVVRNVPPRI
jgi:hypothetical protein